MVLDKKKNKPVLAPEGTMMEGTEHGWPHCQGTAFCTVKNVHAFLIMRCTRMWKGRRIRRFATRLVAVASPCALKTTSLTQNTCGCRHKETGGSRWRAYATGSFYFPNILDRKGSLNVKVLVWSQVVWFQWLVLLQTGLWQHCNNAS